MAIKGPTTALCELQPRLVESRWGICVVIAGILAATTPPDPCHAAALNVDAAVAYANTWCGARNPAFHDYSNEGGDCANFVSQCLIAGGALKTTYPGVPGLIGAITALGAKSIDPAEIQAGDVIQMYCGSCRLCRGPFRIQVRVLWPHGGLL